MELSKVPFTKLLKLEVPELADNVIRVLQNFETEELLIEDVLVLLKAQKPQIDLLTSRYGIHPLTADLAQKNGKLFFCVSAIKFELRAVRTADNPENQQHLATVQLAIDKHLLKLRRSRNSAVVLRRVAQFLHETTVSVDLMGAVAALGLSDHISNLQEALSEVWLLQDRKEAIISQRPEESSKEIAAPVIFALKNVFKQVELLMVINPAVDYSDLFRELNQLINVYRSRVARRDALNKKKAEEKKALEAGGSIEQPEVDVDLEGSDEPTELTQTSELMAPRVHVASTNGEITPEEVEKLNINGNKEGLKDDSDQSLDQKKTAASSSKNMQLPDVNDEA